MGKRPALVTALVKETICGKAKVDGMEKPSYLPSCLQQCSDMCGVRCKKKCFLKHPGCCSEGCKAACTETHPAPCNRGKLDDRFLYCPSNRANPVIDYITYAPVPVVPYGKGADFTRVEQVNSKQWVISIVKREQCKGYFRWALSNSAQWTQCNEQCKKHYNAGTYSYDPVRVWK